MAAALTLPMDGTAVDLPFAIVGRAPKQNGKWESDDQLRFVSPHYFVALRIPLVRGRYFDRRDAGKASKVVIINDAFAKKYWPQGDPLGQQMLIGNGLGADFEESRARLSASWAALLKSVSARAQFRSCMCRKARLRKG